jgi:hypothetical protein
MLRMKRSVSRYAGAKKTKDWAVKRTSGAREAARAPVQSAKKP